MLDEMETTNWSSKTQKHRAAQVQEEVQDIHTEVDEDKLVTTMYEILEFSVPG